jgi:hypothetical protein
MERHADPNQSKARASEALSELARLLAHQAAHEMLAACSHDDCGDRAALATFETFIFAQNVEVATSDPESLLCQ